MHKALATAALAAATIVAGISSAAADGMPRSPIAYSAPYNWSGFYFGVHAGGAWSETEWSGPANFYGVNRFSIEPSGFIGGGHLGVQHQWGNFVAGVEVSYDGSTAKDRIVGPVPAFPQDTFTTRVNDLLMVVGRVGYAQGNWMVYAKGGYANGDVDVSGLSGAPVAGVTFKDGDRLNGWTVGGGWEWMVRRNVTLGLEYNFVQLNGEHFSPTTGGAAPGLPLSIDLDDVRVQSVMGRLTFKFDRDRVPPPPLK